MESDVFPRSIDGVLPQDTRVWIPSMIAEMRARELNQPVTGEGISPTAASVASLFGLNDVNGNAVAFSVTPIVDGAGRDVYYMLTPEELLPPGEYQIVGTSTTFSIGTVSTATPPAPPEIESQHSSSDTGTGSSCGESRAEHFQFVSGSPLLLAAANLKPRTEGDTWQTSALTASTFLSVGQTACGTIDWDFDDGPVDIRFAALNFSGQTSTWTEPERIFVDAPGCACALVGHTGAPQPSSLWVYALCGLALARRSTRRALSSSLESSQNSENLQSNSKRSRASLTRRRAWRAAPLVLAAAFCLRPATASACKCSKQSDVFPRPTDGALPQDTRVWISSVLAERRARELNQPVAGDGISPTSASMASLFGLKDANGNAVAFSVTPIVDGQGRDVFYVFTPDKPFVTGEYQVDGAAATFSIGAEPTATRPEPPELESRHSSSDTDTTSSCGESRAEHFRFASGFPLLLAAANLEPRTEGDTWQASALTSSPFVSVGQTACGTIDWDFDDGPVDIRFAALNFAGQTSSWTEPERIFVDAPDCDCALVGHSSAPKGSSLWIYALCGLAFARRAARHPLPGL